PARGLDEEVEVAMAEVAALDLCEPEGVGLPARESVVAAPRDLEIRQVLAEVDVSVEREIVCYRSLEMRDRIGDGAFSAAGKEFQHATLHAELVERIGDLEARAVSFPVADILCAGEESRGSGLDDDEVLHIVDLVVEGAQQDRAALAQRALPLRAHLRG